MKIAAIPFNPLVADIEGNLRRLKKLTDEAVSEGADIIVFPELSITGYPPMDLLFDNEFIDRNLAALDELARHSTGIDIVCGCITRNSDDHALHHNSAVLMRGGRVELVYDKALLPSYDVFDETRYFVPGKNFPVFTLGDITAGLTVCEDVWNAGEEVEDQDHPGRVYAVDPVRELAARGAGLIINISASPYAMGKNIYKRDMLRKLCRSHRVSMLYVNQLGGNDSLIFDGEGYMIDHDGNMSSLIPPFRDGIHYIETGTRNDIPAVDEYEYLFNALVLGLGDYCRKCGFSSAVLGLSGGIDSAITAVIAAHALGSGSVKAITMPSPYSSDGSVSDSLRLAENLGIHIDIVPISPIMDAYMKQLAMPLNGREGGLMEENIQARIRGNLLMAVSNMEGSIVLSTGNKSELATGYCTLYGDMSGGLAVISDVPKTTVYALAGYVNRNGEVIPGAIIDKAPSAELKPGQTDQDTLPPYDILDGILECYIEKGMSPGRIIDTGYDSLTVHRVIRMVDRSEYKRRQAAPGLKVTGRAFGSGRRIPLARAIND